MYSFSNYSAKARAQKPTIIACIVCMLSLAGVVFLYTGTDQVFFPAWGACTRVDWVPVARATVGTLLLLMLLLLLSHGAGPRLALHLRFRTTTATPVMEFGPQDTVQNFISRYAASQPAIASLTCTGRLKT
jgi:hypothetical protein